MICSKCKQDKVEEEFYKTKWMKRGRASQCKLCMRTNPLAKERDKKHNSTYFKTEAGKQARARGVKRFFERNPQKAAAIRYVGVALSRGQITKKPCVICGNPESEAHHPDYSKKLDVVWLCDYHHKLEHKNKKEQVP